MCFKSDPAPCADSGEAHAGVRLHFRLVFAGLGLAIAEVLGGFARVMRLHAEARAGRERTVRVGWLVPLLAVLVLFNQLQFWMTAFSVRDRVPLNFLTLLVVLVVVGGYYLFSALVFPEDPEKWPDFDTYYDLHNRFILTGMFVINIIVAGLGGVYRAPASARQIAARAGLAGDIAALGVFVGLALLLALIGAIMVVANGF